MEIIVVLGADRVGKSTLIRKTEALCKSAAVSSHIWHFSEVKPWHHSPIDQFLKKFDEMKAIRQDLQPQYLLIDRFVSDTLFYEPYRNRFEKVDPSWARSVESGLLELSSSVEYVLLEHGWDEEMVKRHTEEIKREGKNAVSKYWIDLNLEVRKKEHFEYYKHTGWYLSKSTNIPCRYIGPDSSTLLKV